MVPPRPTEMRDLSCMALTRRIEKQRTMASGWKKCLKAQIMSVGGRSQGTTLANRHVTPTSRRIPRA